VPVCTGACAVDIYNQLPQAARFQPALELTITLQPGSLGEAPSVASWQVQYSCSDSR
jgi:hypothetical protein